MLPIKFIAVTFAFGDGLDRRAITLKNSFGRNVTSLYFESGDVFKTLHLTDASNRFFDVWTEMPMINYSVWSVWIEEDEVFWF